VGPHGTGKSTLLATLLPELARAGRESLLVVLHDGQRTLSRTVWLALRRAGQEGRHLMIVIDGYEQLSPWSRFWIRRYGRRHGHGLLVTAHVDMGFPELYRTEVTPEIALRVVAYLTPESERAITPAEVASRLAVRDGDLRETLFDLYDLHESRKREGITPARKIRTQA
jgi:hypothetical protein